MYHATIEWGDSTRLVEKTTTGELLDWLTNLYDATGQTPEIFNESGDKISIRYDERGRAKIA